MSTYTLYLVEEKPAVSKYPIVCQYENLNAGVDLVTVEDWVLGHGETHLLDLGVKAMLMRNDTNTPSHFWLLPRSSIFKTGYLMANSVGVIDLTYRGTLKAPVVAIAPGAAGFKAGARHFQIVAPDMGWIKEVRLVQALPDTERGEGGFGSTGA